MKFTKMHGCGNDYIFVSESEIAGRDMSELAILMSNRKKGIGSDGLIVIAPSDEADIKMIMYNSNGSRGKMCGNGIRCLAKYVFERKLVIKTKFNIETDSGIRPVRLYVNGNRVENVQVEMGAYSHLECKNYILDGKKYDLTYLEVGNPHCVIFVPKVENALVDIIGSYLEKHEDFPNGVNTEFVEIVNRETVRLRVWERGSGETLACGTGACAAFAAGYVKGYFEEEINVVMSGGIVKTGIDNNSIIHLYGDANEVFSGDYMI